MRDEGCCSEGKKNKPEPAEEEEEGDFPRVAGWKEIAALGLLTSTTGCTGESSLRCDSAVSVAGTRRVF